MLRPLLFLFDVDYTLLTTGGAGRRAMERTFTDLFGTDEPLRGLPMAGRTDRAILKEALSRLPEPQPLTPALEARFRALYVHHLAATLPRSEGRVLPGVVALLKELKQRGIAVGLATGNFREGAMLKLRHYGLAEFFSDGGFGDDSEERSEVVAIAIKRFAQRLGFPIPPERVCVVGDTPFDIAAGQALRCLTFGIGTGPIGLEELAQCTPTFLYTDFSDTATILEQCLPVHQFDDDSLVVVREVEDAQAWQGAQEVRRRVFIEEQGIPEELEMDELDPWAHHVVAWQDGAIVGTGRLVVLDRSCGRIGRMAVLASHRRRGIGRAILHRLEALARRLGLSEIVLHAQVPALGFYERAGYSGEGEPFEEAGIPHLAMRKALREL